MNQPLIAPKPFAAYTPDEYHVYVSGMYELRTKGPKKPPKPVPGLTVSRTKAGALTVRRSKTRAFAYVTIPEVAALAAEAKCSQADMWNMFKQKKFIIAKDRITAEHLHMQKGLEPWAE